MPSIGNLLRRSAFELSRNTRGAISSNTSSHSSTSSSCLFSLVKRSIHIIDISTFRSKIRNNGDLCDDGKITPVCLNSLSKNTLTRSSVCIISNNGNNNINYSNRSHSNFKLFAVRNYHVTNRNESGLIIGGIGLMVAAYGAQYAINGYTAYIEARKKEELESGTQSNESNEKDPKKKPAGSSVWYSSWFARNFYDGGFEDKMTRREAALILGIRESANSARVKEAYLRLLRLNHPDHGGSPYIATKLNEAKEVFDTGRN